MTLQSSLATGAAPAIRLLTAKEAAELLKVSISWLAKARIKGEGPLRQHRALGPLSGDTSCRVGERHGDGYRPGRNSGLEHRSSKRSGCPAKPDRVGHHCTLSSIGMDQH
jgi:hypothetical protein